MWFSYDWLIFMAIFLRGVSLLDDLQAINPYCVYLPHVVLCNALDKPVLHKYAEAAFNASIVGLCCVPDDVAASMKVNI